MRSRNLQRVDYLAAADKLLRENPDEAARLVRLALAAQDPLQEMYGRLTAAQRAWVLSVALKKLAEGGNQSGKTLTGCLDFLLDATGTHPVRQWSPAYSGAPWRGWYCAPTYDLFREQGWEHFKRLLLWPGEDVFRLPTRRILEIGWETTRPEKPMFIKLRRQTGGVAEITIKSYDQGRVKFQSAGLDRVHLDEECPQDIYDEVLMRGVAKAGGQITISATPVIGVPWLAGLRADAEEGRSTVCHARFDTRDNPVADPAYIAEVMHGFRHQPEMINLRLGGYPLALEGLVYHDLCFMPARRIIEPRAIPADWTLRRVVDYGFNNTACLWFATAPGGKKSWLYRDYKGRGKRIEENVAAIKALSGGERYADTWIDPATLGTDGNTGQRIIDLFGDAGLDCEPAAKTQVMTGIEALWKLMGEEDEAGCLRFQVFRSCTEFLEERRNYKWPDASDKGDDRDGPAAKPIKRDDHCMDVWRYWATSGGVTWAPPKKAGPPPLGTKARKMWEIRERNGKRRG